MSIAHMSRWDIDNAEIIRLAMQESWKDIDTSILYMTKSITVRLKLSS